MLLPSASFIYARFFFNRIYASDNVATGRTFWIFVVVRHISQLSRSFKNGIYFRALKYVMRNARHVRQHEKEYNGEVLVVSICDPKVVNL